MSKPTDEAYQDITEAIEEQEDFLSEGEWRALLLRLQARIESLID